MRFAIYSCGILILTFGITLTIQAGLGISPFDALLVGLARNAGLTVGSWEVLIALLMIGCNSLLMRQRPELLGLVTAFISGIGIDLWLFLLHHVVEPKLLPGKLICFGIGIVVIGWGTSLYLQANFAPIPVDRLTLVLQTLTGLNVMYTRTIIYFIFLALAFLCGGPIGIGTLLTVCLGGLILNFFMPRTQRLVNWLQSRAPASSVQHFDLD